MLGGRLRIGDKLMLSGRNLHELGLMNGTMLRLLDDHPADETRRRGRADLGADGADLRAARGGGARLQLAYACSIHKGQGIELPVAVIVAHPAAGAYFLRREMLYTAMTRARMATVIVGQRAGGRPGRSHPDTARRYGRLGERLAVVA